LTNTQNFASTGKVDWQVQKEQNEQMFETFRAELSSQL
jgi:hypothetical protein